jgi:hypothetical protein
MRLKRLTTPLLFLIFSTSSFAARYIPSGTEEDSLAAASKVSKSVVLLEEDEEEKELPGFFDGFSFGGSFGLSLYYGDLADYDIFPSAREYGDFFRSGWRLYAQRDIKWGLGAKIVLDKGSLEGGRQPGLQSRHVSFRTRYHGVAIAANYDLARLIFPRSKISERRFTLHGNIGYGLMWFRSYLFDTNSLLVDNYYGYVPLDEVEKLNIAALSDKTEYARAWKLPIGMTLGYKLNFKTDLTFTVSQTNLFSDEMDAWVRSWSASDKYAYFGFGIRVNLNRGESDMPEKKERERGNEDDADATNSTDTGPQDIEVGDNFRSGRGLNLRKNKRQKNGSGDELLDVRLKMFEIQLKLFEMQYLLQ